MDLLIEMIVKKKSDYLDYLIILGTIIISFIVAFIAILVAGPLYFSIAIVLIAILAYVGYRIITSRNIEYEYSLTNGDLEISKIIAQRKRKRIFYGDCRQFEMIDRVPSDKHNNAVNSVTSKIRSVSSMNSEHVYFIITQFNSKRVIVYFEPNDKILSGIKTFNKKAFR